MAKAGDLVEALIDTAFLVKDLIGTARQLAGPVMPKAYSKPFIESFSFRRLCTTLAQTISWSSLHDLKKKRSRKDSTSV